MAKRNIDLIIPVYKNHEMTGTCVESVLSCIHEIADRDPRLILINDSPDDLEVSKLLSRLAEKFPFVELITNERNLGFVKSVNKGLEISTRDKRDVILINSDTQTFPGTLAELVLAVDLDTQIGFACPRSNNASLCTLPHLPHPFGGRIPSPIDAHKHWLRLRDLLPDVTFVPTAVGFYMYIRHSVLAMFGGLRQDFGVGYEEENDLVMRANKVGFRAVMANKAFAYHYGSASFALSNLHLGDQRSRNFKKMLKLHPEFLPLINRYQATPHFRAEKLLGGLLQAPDGRYKLVIDILSFGCNHNGTTELAVQVIRRICQQWSSQFELTVLCPKDAFEFHKIGSFGQVIRADLTDPGLHTIAVRLGQPFDMHHANVLETIAPINIYGMLDAIALDCGHLSITHNLEQLWGHAAEHANGFFYISEHAEQTFCARFPAAKKLPAYTRLLPTKVGAYQTKPANVACEHILVLGNHFPHKAADYTARLLAIKFPATKIVALGGDSLRENNLQILRAGELDEELVSRMFSRASVVVLPSFAEGFGFGFMHALAAGKPIVARRIPATLEILKTFARYEGIFLFEDNDELFSSVSSAMLEKHSVVDDERCEDWSGWVDGLMRMLLGLIDKECIFQKLCGRIAAGDSLRAFLNASAAVYPSPPRDSSALERLVLPFQSTAQSVSDLDDADDESSATVKGNFAETSHAEKIETLESILQGNDVTFLNRLYRNVLLRAPDDDGLKTYSSLLARGALREDIVVALASSLEGRKIGARLHGLDALMAAQSSPDSKGLLNWFAKGSQITVDHDHVNARASHDGSADSDVKGTKARQDKGAENLAVLLQGDDLMFLDSLYNTLLLRAPDDDGLKNYLSQLERGALREDIVADVASSEEGRRIDARLPGLEKLLAARKRRRSKGIFSWFSKKS